MSCLVSNYFIATFVSLFVIGSCSIPDYIKICHQDDADLAGCIKKSIEALRPRLKSGIPELEVPPIEPLNIDTLGFGTSTNATRLSTNLTNIEVWGASDFQILKIKPKLTKNGQTFQFEVIIPQLRIEGDYTIDSKVLLIELRGNGPFHANISDFHFECVLKGQKIEKNGSNHLQFEKMDCNLVVGKTSIVLDNLFNGNPILGKATNDAINDNSEAFFEEIRPSILNAVRQKFTDIANKITLYFTYEELFP